MPILRNRPPPTALDQGNDRENICRSSQFLRGRPAGHTLATALLGGLHGIAIQWDVGDNDRQGAA